MAKNIKKLITEYEEQFAKDQRAAFSIEDRKQIVKMSRGLNNDLDSIKAIVISLEAGFMAGYNAGKEEK